MIERAGVAKVVLAIAAMAMAVGCAPSEPQLGTGPHAELRCDECHEPRGEDGSVGFASADACRTCHPPAEISPVVEAKGVRFPHRPHWDLLAGLESPCSACHTHSGPGADLSVDESSCYLCHAVIPSPGSKMHAAFFPEGSCLECHGPETHEALVGQTVPVDHGAVLARGIECTICHHDVLEGSGAVAQQVCRTCHASPDAVAMTEQAGNGDAAMLHQQHFRQGREPACGRCHDGLEHREVGVASAAALVCESCHTPGDPDLAAPIDSTVHRAQQLLYAGLAAEHEQMLPAGKFAARVSCAACHSSESMSRTADPAVAVGAMNAECVACHGPGFSGLLENWVEGMRSRTGSVGRYVQETASAPAVRSVAAADSLAQLALRHWHMVDAGNGVHNIPAAHALLRQALGEAGKSWKAAGREAPQPPSLAPDPAEETCARCHYGIEASRTDVGGVEFDHRTHVIEQGLACASCHSPNDLFLDDRRTFDPAHGSTVSLAECARCHHAGADASSCGTCHSDEELARGRPVTLSVSVGGGSPRPREVSWVHDGHRDVACDRCHGITPAGGITAGGESCRTCHSEHHTADRDCAACHRLPEIRAAHSPDTHTECDVCHSRGTIETLVPDRRFCLVCHGEQVDHHAEPGAECAACHFLASPAELRPRLMTGKGAP
ncbi:MAG: cytochrome c3 family protein [Candidatus Eiseniibacteriota bacterium]